MEKSSGKKGDDAEESLAQVIPMAPLAVNLNKNSSNAQDRYLCLNLSLVLKELMPDQEIPKLHPRAIDAANMFLSSLVYGDVENFDQIKIQKNKLVNILNPYMDEFIEDIKIEHVMVASSMAKVEEFIIEHTLGKTETAAGDEEGDEKKEDADKE